MVRMLLVVVAVLGLTCVVTYSQSADERLMGTWKLNVEKSKFTSPAPKSQTLTWKPSATGFDFTANTVNAQGQANQGSTIRGTTDGKGYTVKGTTQTYTRTTKRIDPFTYEETEGEGGNIRLRRKAVVSNDGKTMTVTTEGINAQGVKVNNVAVYERQ
jgi:hypothetical protein